MEDSKKNIYIAGGMFSFVAVILIMIAINSGWNFSGQLMGVVGLLFGVLGVGSFWKPDSIGQIAAQIMENMQENAERQNRPRDTKKTTTKIIATGDVYNITDSEKIKIDSSKKSSKRTKR